MSNKPTIFNSNPGLASFYTNDVNSRSIALLEAIGSLGSISAAAKQLKMSYRSAWDAVNEMNNLWDSPLVVKSPGGTQGGGTLVTPQGYDLIAGLKLIHQEYQRISQGLNCSLEDFNQFQLKIRRLSMRTSARNQFQGKVEHITLGPVNAEIKLAISNRDSLIAMVTRESVDHLGLAVGADAYALIKASFIILATADENYKTSARNQLYGSITDMRHGPVNTEVVIELDGGKSLTAIITENSAEGMELAVGSPVYALIKSSHVILGVN
jgi:molybdate transport system regulatory protein